jgi:ABC-type polysaccharide/polyol phosphate transport system ATPase subunit/SAM-dependent methyltransferase
VRPAIRVAGVSKTFRLPHESRTLIRDYFLHPLRRTTFEDQHALVDVCFEITQGEFFGVIGRNGSGKSTLLKILAGIYPADTGTVEVAGKLSPFIELGVGFNPELTGRENVHVNATLLGLTTAELAERFDAIIDFAELHRFVDQKLKNYSSGMQLRLAYSIAIQVPFDILLLDEVLAVGDQNFQDKCFATFDQMRESGKTVVFVTHGLASVARFCDRAILIRDGIVQSIGEPSQVIDLYLEQEREREGRPPAGPKAAKGVETAGRVAAASHEAVAKRTARRVLAVERWDRVLVALDDIEDLLRHPEGRLETRGEQIRELADVRREVREAERELDQAQRMLDTVTARHYAPVPLPPENVRARMSPRSSALNYFAQGLTVSEQAVALFGSEPHEPILEWGCGSGRSARWLTCYDGWVEQYGGCDSDDVAIAWVTENLPMLRFAVCAPEPPLPYEDGSFAGVFTFGTLTAVHPERHQAWWAELARILRPNGRAIALLQGPSLVPDGRAADGGFPSRDLGERGWAFIANPGARNAAFVTESHVRSSVDGALTVDEYRPRGHGPGDLYVLRRR